ncbi:TetR/AcrR family transcriptional regulator [Leucobacter chromiiresistens]|uniref:Regulatory protein, tetR family n=1 Tax=Leucobacter chromiiresistens TaxID=1079994 RepID=A0A1H0ZFH5_9MICO|nr:TetR family transcriptional regulator C-terminal domain-containing protein [Leucobacter chromiiresistens]SDQ25841.1 regulatory protein, tetR family [Leucobacter chromiiresistens]
MPRRIDPAGRTAEIAAAALRILEREGLSHLSVRGVAAESGVAPVSLRRLFPTQQALREYCLELIQERATARIAALELEGRELAEALLAQLLPLDAERRLEIVAQVQLGVLALTDHFLRPAAQRLHDGVDRACSAAIGILDDSGRLHAARQPAFEATRLRALLDGIAMQGLWRGDAAAPADALTTLSRHLDELALPPPSPEQRRA